MGEYVKQHGKELMEARASLSVAYHLKKKQMRFMADYRPGEDKRIFNYISSYFGKVGSVLKSVGNKIENVTGISCSGLLFDGKRFTPAGGFVFPTKFHLPTDLSQKVGGAELIGLILKFNKSAIGLDQAEVELVGKDIGVETRINYKISLAKPFLRKINEHTEAVARLFVEEKK